MERETRIKDSPRAIDDKDMMKKARRQAYIRAVWQGIGIILLVFLIVFAWRCLSSILDFAAEEEIPEAGTVQTD